MPQVWIVHPALAAAPGSHGVPAERRAVGIAGGDRLTDRQRLAVVLQGAGLLSLLERAGWGLVDGWAGATVAAGGVLSVPRDAVGVRRPDRMVQTLLRDLLLCLFGGGGVAGIAVADAAMEATGGMLAGRGGARRAARGLYGAWRQVIVPVSADVAVVAILEAAPFLWEPAHAAARRGLAGELGDAAGATALWVAGPSAGRARLLAGCNRLSEVSDRLAGGDARGWWGGPAPAIGGGSDLTIGQVTALPRQAPAPRRAQPVGEAERLQVAAALFGRGRFLAALAVLDGARSGGARLLRVRCQVQLGRLGAAMLGLRRLETAVLSKAETIEAAETAVRVLANRGEPAPVDRWVARVLAIGDRGSRAEQARGHLVAALAAWDRQQIAAMDEHLAAARACGEGLPVGLRDVGWRWHHACGLRAMAAADGKAVVLHLERALGDSRRGLALHEAAGLWNDLGIGRVQIGDLARAERAFLHAQRLFARCDGPRRTTLALLNLAEVRLRRGRTLGVAEILAQSSAENRRAGNVRGDTQDAELWMRLALVQGRCDQAVQLGRAALERLGRRRLSWRRDVLAILMARALGWLERAAEAATELTGTSTPAVAELEPEERPALWAHAGDRAAAISAAAVLPPGIAALWRAALAGQPAPPDAWAALDGIECFRAARLLFDLERAAAAAGGPCLASSERCAAAAATLREVGAGILADWLASRAAEPWEALGRYAAAPAGDSKALAELLRRAGGATARLTWIPSAPDDGCEAAPAGDGRGALLAGGGGAASQVGEGGVVPLVGDGRGATLVGDGYGALLVGDGFGAPLARDGGAAPQVDRARGALPAGDGRATPRAIDQVCQPGFDQPAGLVKQVAGGRWELRGCAPGAAVSACFALAIRDLDAGPVAAGARAVGAAGGPDTPDGVAPPGRRRADDVGGGAHAVAIAAGLIGSHPVWRTAMERLGRVATAVDLPVLIQGESGTGKELAARAIHRASSRASGPFLAVNCAALAESLLLSDLFGHVRGAFTGADRDRAGVFEAAQGGTVLLDEIGDLPLAAQGLLLRVLQEREVRRLGESVARRIDVRVLAATHCDLDGAVAAATFRRDLFYRLKVGAVLLPPLRERGDDVLEIADFLLRRAARPAPPAAVAAAARLKLRRHPWPGNVRELENVLRLATALAGGGEIQSHHLELAPAPTTAAGSYHRQVEQLRRRLVGEAIAAAGGRHAEAARRLGLSRQALSYLVRELGLR